MVLSDSTMRPLSAGMRINVTTATDMMHNYLQHLAARVRAPSHSVTFFQKQTGQSRTGPGAELHRAAIATRIAPLAKERDVMRLSFISLLCCGSSREEHESALTRTSRAHEQQ
jgi:hypothetical protein